MLSLNIKENTLKYHNRNIYNKLGVSSRKQLIELALSAEHTNQS
jgi:DNA-binding CsgD family transcriptional regulator